MTVFFIAASSLLLMAIMLLAIPWLRAKRNQQRQISNQQQMNLELSRQRLRELEREWQEGLLSDEDKTQAEQELKSALADEYADTAEKGAKPNKPWLAGGIAIILVLLVGSVYWHSNQLGKMQHWHEAMQDFPALAKRAVMQADASVTEQELVDLALGLRTSLRDKPDDAVGWLLLGRVYNSVGYLESAIQAFEKSLQINPEHKGAKISLSQSLAMTNDPAQLKKAKGYLQQVLQQSPDDYDALGLLAIVASQLDDKPLAVNSWQQLQQQVPKTDPLYQSISQRLAELQGTEQSATESQTGFTIRVDLAQSIKDKVPDKGFVVVFAQDAQTEMKMPAAVVKQPLKNWPIEVELSDNNAMLASYKLSDLKQARLVARISVDENVQQAVGDLQGEVVVAVQSGQNVSAAITIDQEVKSE